MSKHSVTVQVLMPLEDDATLDHQELYHPTVPTVARLDTGDRKKELAFCRRRLADARVWDEMSDDHQKAATRIHDGFRFLTQGIVAGSILSRLLSPGGGGPGADFSDYQAECVIRYGEWRYECQREKRDFQAVLMYFVEGHGLDDIDQMQRKRKNTALRRIVDALDIYLELAGWKKRGQVNG